MDLDRLDLDRVGGDRTTPAVAEAERWTAHNYHPLPVVVADAVEVQSVEVHHALLSSRVQHLGPPPDFSSSERSTGMGV